jgi:predicted acetyltransferase
MDNIGSVKTIINNSGILDSEGIDKGEVFQRYWIDLS